MTCKAYEGKEGGGEKDRKKDKMKEKKNDNKKNKRGRRIERGLRLQVPYGVLWNGSRWHEPILRTGWHVGIVPIGCMQNVFHQITFFPGRFSVYCLSCV